MKDQRGLYYYPFIQNKKVRMYVSEAQGSIRFRLWSSEDSKLWEEHGWVPYEAIRQAGFLFDAKKSNFDPGQAYNIEIAKLLLKEAGETQYLSDQC